MLVGFCHLQPGILTNKETGTGQETLYLKLLRLRMDRRKEGKERGKKGENNKKINKGESNLNKIFMCGRQLKDLLNRFSVVCATCILSCFSHVQLFSTLWTVVWQAPLSMGFSKQEYWSGLPCPPPGDLPNSGIKPVAPVALALQVDSLLLSHRGSPLGNIFVTKSLWILTPPKIITNILLKHSTFPDIFS